MPALNEITPPQLMQTFGTAEAPLVLDVTDAEDFAADPVLIPTARRADFRDPLSDMSGQITRPIVAICKKGLKLSHGAAALLRQRGHSCVALAGGKAAWRAAALPLIPFAAIPEPQTDTLWAAPDRLPIDQIAAAWLLRRFIDPMAEILLVPANEVTSVGDRFGATVFGRDTSDESAFDSMVSRFALNTDALARLAVVIRDATNDGPDATPEAAGLRAMAHGLMQADLTDTARIDAGLTLCDTLYSWAREGSTQTGHAA